VNVGEVGLEDVAVDSPVSYASPGPEFWQAPIVSCLLICRDQRDRRIDMIKLTTNTDDEDD
jgi:hypothetical protein